eukprot:2611189-Pyramimonas_sp.AAC.1
MSGQDAAGREEHHVAASALVALDVVVLWAIRMARVHGRAGRSAGQPQVGRVDQRDLGALLGLGHRQ